jgi:hypothetical protein
MADIQTKPTKVSPASFIKKIEGEQRRKDCREIAKMMEEITGEPPKMWGPSIVGFGTCHYKYASGREGDMILTGFSPRKQNLTLYIGPGLDDKAMMAKLGPHKTAKSCLYIKTLDDVDLKVLRSLIKKSVDEMRRRSADSKDH